MRRGSQLNSATLAASEHAPLVRPMVAAAGNREVCGMFIQDADVSDLSNAERFFRQGIYLVESTCHRRE